MKVISIFERAGAFSENKDVAKDIRVNEIIPALDKGENIILDFFKVDAVTQSFIHALISDILRRYGAKILERIEFKSCNIKVQKIIEIVVEYTQEGMGIEGDND